MTLCKISFLPVVLELSPGVFNNSVLAVSGGISQAGSVRQLARTLTHSASQGGGGGRCWELLPASETRRSQFVLLLSSTVCRLCCFYYFMHTGMVFPSFPNLILVAWPNNN